MKRIISVVLICMMILSSLAFVSCDNEKGEGAQTTSTALVLQNSGSSSSDSVSKKTPRELLEAFVKDYKNSRSFDISVTMVTTEGAESLTEQADIKLSEESAYISVDMGGAKMKVWYVDGVTYVDMDGEKYKTSSEDMDDILGEGFIDSFIGEIPSEFPEEYMKKVDEAKLKTSGGEYYFSVTLSAEEAALMELGDEGYTETIYFDRTGRLTRIVDEAEGYNVTARLNSYGEKVTVSAPENAASFEDVSDVGGGEGSEQYKAYVNVCNVLKNASSYYMIVDVDGEPYMDYETDGQGEMVFVSEDEDYYIMWNVGGKGYVSKNDNPPRETSLTNEMRQAFSSAKSLKEAIAVPFDEEDMPTLSYREYSNGSGEIRFDYIYSTGTLDTYVIEFEKEGDRIVNITINISSMVDYEVVSEILYHFGGINDRLFRIEAPI